MPLVLDGSNGISSNGTNFNIRPTDTGVILNGIATMPSLPTFKVHVSGSPSIANSSLIPWNVATYNGGNHYTVSSTPSLSRFTAPVAGTYVFGGMVRMDINTTYIHLNPLLNGVINANNGELPGLTSTFNGTGFCAASFAYARYMQAGDYIQFHCNNPGVSPFTIHPQSYMYGYLAG
jgi:hypothetical protein